MKFQGFVTMLILLDLVLLSVLSVRAQDDQSGFISIDCGIGEGETYTDDVTNIKYVSDVNFTDSGETHEILSEYQSDVDKHLRTLTSFPNNKRNCYTIKPSQGTGNRYLIRARFMYGYYDQRGQLPEFDLHIGPNYWDTIRINSSSKPIYKEIIHVLLSDYIHVCLVNTGRGTPFISAIELRLLPIDMYNQTNSGSLVLRGRYDFGIASGIIRYDADKYDRQWNATSLPDTRSLNTPGDINTRNIFDPPSEIMSNAITPIHPTDSLTLKWQPLNTADQFFIYLYFAETEVLAANETREFNIYLNGYFFFGGPFSPGFHTTTTIHSTQPETSTSTYIMNINKTRNSTLPPIINALELYTLKVLPQRQTYDKDVAAIRRIKSTYGLTKNWQGDPCAPQEFVWDGITCSNDDPVSPRIIMLNLSDSGLNGGIDSAIANLPMMQTLDLSNNNLTGTVPDFLSGLKSLTELNLKGNNFIGAIPSVLLEKSNKGSLILSFDGDSTAKNKKGNEIIVFVIAAVSVVAILIALVVVWKIIQKKPRASDVLHTRTNAGLEIRKEQYSYSDIHNITNNFSVVLGRGASGKVYRGTVAGGTPVAVKMLSGSSEHEKKQFLDEARLLLTVHHKNLTSLIGYCNDEIHKGIIYEYMANGNLESYLLDKTSSVLNWEKRLQIGCDVAQGLEYMHHGCKTPVVHRDVKCTNILLNEASQAKLGDFGLSRAFPVDGSHISTNVIVGTHGYLDPEYQRLSKLTTKSDVYSFGVVLLVLITGQPAITKTDSDYLHISQIVGVKLESGDMNDIVDPTLHGDFDVSSAWKVVELAMTCVSFTPNERPTMKEVVMELIECLATERARKKAIIPNPNVNGFMSIDLELAHDPTPV